MTKETRKTFWNLVFEYLRISKEHPELLLTNPAVEFIRKTKQGDFDSISEEEYKELLENARGMSALWDCKTAKTPAELFVNGMTMLEMPEGEMARLADFMSEMAFRQADESLLNADVVYDPAKEQGSFEEEIASGDGWNEYADVTPKDILQRMDRIYGQEDAKRRAAMVLYNHLNGRKQNALFCGPTGCGKTEIWRTLSEFYPLIRIVDGTQLAPDGWKGSLHMRDIFHDIPVQQRSKTIIVVDEADKMLEPQIGSGGTDHSLLLQNNWLKIMEGDLLSFGNEDSVQKAFSVDCSGISIVFLGAFERVFRQLEKTAPKGLGFGAELCRNGQTCDYSNTKITIQDLIGSGNMRREIAGRINTITVLNPMKENDFYNMLNEDAVSPILRLQKEYRAEIQVEDSLKHKLAGEAARFGLGCRYMNAELRRRLDELVFENPRADLYEIRDE